MASVEKDIKNQFARFFRSKDWRLFKRFADYYLKRAVFLKKANIEIEDPWKLLARNIQKRLDIGIGCELLLKAVYLKNGFVINKPRSNNLESKPPFFFEQVDEKGFLDDDTYSFNNLIDHLPKVYKFSKASKRTVSNGLRIAKVFRNKEAHVVVELHKFNPQNYTDIELAIREIYQQCFGEILSVRFSMGRNAKPVWRIDRPTNGIF